MGMTMTEVGGPTGIAYFSDQVGTSRTWQLKAVVAWKQPPAPALGWRERLRGLTARLAARRTARREAERRVRDWTLPEGWSGASDGGGAREVLFSAHRGLVRVRGQDHALPSDGRALVLLVTEGADGSDAVSVDVHTMEAPAHPIWDVDPALPKRENLKRMSEVTRSSRDAWRASVGRDPVVGAFLRAAART